MVELWRAGVARSTTSAAEARQVEAEGWDGQMFMDSQSLSLDPYVMMGLWAGATERLRLSTGVTNPFTRHLSVTANSAASVHMLSGGRAVLGLGRGDSALAYLGLSPVGIAAFERAIIRLQCLLRREAVAFEPSSDAASLEALSLGARPEETALRWLPADIAKVPLDIAATGPKVIALAARLAERVTFSVGAVSERLEWALGLARAVEAGPVSYGAQLLVYCHSDPLIAVEEAARSAAALARFQVMQGQAAGPTTSDDDANFEAIRTNYDMTSHGVVHAKDRLMGMTLGTDFIRRFAIAGTPDQCHERLSALIALGIDRIVCVGPSSYPESWGEERHLFVREVLPALKG